MAIVSIVVNTAPPVAVDQVYQLNQDTTLTVNSTSGLLAGDTDADSAPLTAALVSSPADGTASVNADGSFTYTPNAGYYGPDSFTYEANDGVENSNVANVVLWINQPPTAVSLSNSTLADDRAGGAVVGLLSTDDANPGDTFTYSLVTDNGGGADNGYFNIAGDELQTKVELDYATNSSYSIDDAQHRLGWPLGRRCIHRHGEPAQPARAHGARESRGGFGRHGRDRFVVGRRWNGHFLHRPAGNARQQRGRRVRA